MTVLVVICVGIGGTVALLGGDGENGSEDKTGGASSPDAPGQNSPAALLKRVRATDPCSLHDASFLKRFGPDLMLQLSPLNGCVATAGKRGDQNSDVFSFVLEVGQPYTYNPLDERDEVAGYPADHSSLVDKNLDDGFGQSEDRCYYHLPHGELDFAVFLRVRKFPAADTADQAWPERCQVAKEYLTAIAETALKLPPRENPVEKPSVEGKDPCADSDAAARAVTGWTAEEPLYRNAYECQIELTKQEDTQILTIKWTLGTTPSPTPSLPREKVESIQLGGLDGVQSTFSFASGDEAGGGTCGNELVAKPEDPNVENSAQLVHVTLNVYGAGSGEPPAPAPSCDTLNQVTEIVLDGLGS